MKKAISSQKALIIILVIILTAAVLLWVQQFRRGGRLVAEVVIQGETVLEIPLKPDEDSKTWNLQEEYNVPVHLETDHGRIRFIDVSCPDHICEKTGWLSMAYQSAVCMPNRTVVTVYPEG